MKCAETISYNGIMETGGIILRRCPITNGAETRMTEAGFKAICTATRKRMSVFSFSRNSTKQTVVKKSFCAECRGKILPAELIIITQEEIGEMTAIKKGPGECAICGRKTTVFINHDTLTCSNCAAVQAAITKRPGAVAEIITQLGKTSEIVGMLGGQIGAAAPVPDDGGTAGELMEQIREKYNLESIFLIPSFIDNLVAEIEAWKKISDGMSEDITHNLRRAHAAETVVKDVRSTLAIEPGESIIKEIFGLKREYHYAKEDLKCAEQVIEAIHEKIGKGKGETVLDAVARLQRERQQATDIWFEVCGILNIGPADMLSLPGVVREMAQSMKDIMTVVSGDAHNPVDEPPTKEPLIEYKKFRDAEALLETALDCLKGWPISQERMAWLIEEAFGRESK